MSDVLHTNTLSRPDAPVRSARNIVRSARNIVLNLRESNFKDYCLLGYNVV